MDIRFFEAVMCRPAGARVFNIAYYGISQEWQLKEDLNFDSRVWEQRSTTMPGEWTAVIVKSQGEKEC